MLYFLSTKNSEKNKNKSINFALKAESYKKELKYNLAVNLIRKAIILDKDNDSFYYQYAFILMLTKNYKKALEQINKAISINEMIYYYYLLRADILTFLNNQIEVEKNLLKAISLKEYSFLYYSNLIPLLNTNDNKDIISLYYKQIEKLQVYSKQKSI